MSEAASLSLRSARFRKEREADWRRLEEILARADKGKPLTDEDMIAAPRLYRAALSSLSVARATSLDSGLIAYLEALSTRGYFFVYGARVRLFDRARDFFRDGWPRAVAGLWRETIAAAALLLLGAICAGALVLSDPDWFYAFVPRELAAGRDPAAATETLANTLRAAEGDERAGLGVFAASLFTHNAQIALFAFALGFAFGAPTAVLLFYNGCTLGAFCALFASRGLGVELGGWLLIHGATELFAVALAGAAGFRIGLALAFPGARSRIDAGQIAGRQAALVMAGAVLMLLVAGLLEGFGRQLIGDTTARYGIAAATFALWCLYFYAPRGRHGA